MNPNWLTTRQVLDALGITNKTTLYQRAETRGVEPVKMGKMLFWPPDAPDRLKPKRPRKVNR